MKRIKYGSLDSRALFFDLACPFIFSRWVPQPVYEWRLSPVRMLNPLNWLSVCTQKHYWAFSFSNHAGSNNRCYCDGGRSISISVTIAGFFVRCWYSHFTGNVPCPCDEAAGVRVMMLLPPAPGTCPICATAHAAENPHNGESLYYMYRFYGVRGRWPTWADAIAHCTAELQTLWKRALQDRGAWTEPEIGDPIADPPMESVHQPIGDINARGYGPEFNP